MSEINVSMESMEKVRLCLKDISVKLYSLEKNMLSVRKKLSEEYLNSSKQLSKKINDSIQQIDKLASEVQSLENIVQLSIDGFMDVDSISKSRINKSIEIFNELQENYFGLASVLRNVDFSNVKDPFLGSTSKNIMAKTTNLENVVSAIGSQHFSVEPLNKNTISKINEKAKSIFLNKKQNLVPEFMGFEASSRGKTLLSPSFVNLSNGNFIIKREDFHTPGFRNSLFCAIYNSMDNQDSEIGQGWQHTFGVKLIQIRELELEISFEDGYKERYVRKETGIYKNYKNKERSIILNEQGYYVFKLERGKEYIFSVKGSLEWKTDGNGNKTKINYNNGMIESISGNDGSLRFEYDNNNKITTISNDKKQCVQYFYEENKLIRVTNTEGINVIYQYDENEKISKMSDDTGTVNIINFYDESGRVIEQRFNDGSRCSFKYDDENYKIMYTGRNNEEIEFEKDARWRITKINSVHGTKKMLFGDEDQILSYTDENNNNYRYQYNERSLITKIIYPNYSVAEYIYNQNQNPVQKKDQFGNTIIYEYESSDNLSKIIINNEKNILKNILYKYNEQNKLEQILCTNNLETRIFYDEHKNITKKINGDMAICYKYDENGEIHEINTDNRKIKKKYVYDQKIKYFVDISRENMVYNDSNKIKDSNDAIVSILDEHRILNSKTLQNTEIAEIIAKKLLIHDKTDIALKVDKDMQNKIKYDIFKHETTFLAKKSKMHPDNS